MFVAAIGKLQVMLSEGDLEEKEANLAGRAIEMSSSKRRSSRSRESMNSKKHIFSADFVY